MKLGKNQRTGYLASEKTEIIDRQMTLRTVTIVLIPLLLLMVQPLTAASSQEQQEQSSDDDNVTIVNQRLTKSNTTTTIVGEVRNDSPTMIGRIQVNGKLYDSSGQLIELGHSSRFALDVQPGEKRPFVLTFSDPMITENVASYTLSTEVSSLSPQDKPATLKVGISKHGMIEKNTGTGVSYQVIGNVTNMGNLPVTFVEVIATFYDSADKIVDFDTNTTLPSDIPAGQSADFIIDALIGPGGNYTAETQKIASVNVTADSSEYRATEIVTLS